MTGELLNIAFTKGKSYRFLSLYHLHNMTGICSMILTFTATKYVLYSVNASFTSDFLLNSNSITVLQSI